MSEPDAKTQKTTADLLIATYRHVEQLTNVGIVDAEQLRFTVIARKDRKLVVPALKANGLSNREIARQVGVNERSVRRDLSPAANAAPNAANAAPVSEQQRAADAEKREAADVEKEKRETLLRLAEGAYRSAGAFAVSQVRAELIDRLRDRKFTHMLVDRLRLGVEGAPTIEEMLLGAHELAKILKGV